MHQGACSDQDVGVADQVAASIQVSIHVRGPNDYIIGQRKHTAFPASLLKGGDLTGSPLGFQPAQNLVASNDRESEAPVVRQILACGALNADPEPS